MEGLIDMEQMGCELIGCWTHYVTLSYDLDLGCSRSNFEMTVSRCGGGVCVCVCVGWGWGGWVGGWGGGGGGGGGVGGQLTWYERNVSGYGFGPTLSPWTLTHLWSWPLICMVKSFKYPYLRNGKVYYTPRFNEVEGGYTGFTLSICPSVDRIVSALYFPQ